MNTWAAAALSTVTASWVACVVGHRSCQADRTRGTNYRAPEQQQDADADAAAAAGAGADAGADAGAVAAGPVVAVVVEAVEAEAEAVDVDDWDPIRQRYSRRYGDRVRAARRRQDAADALLNAAAQLSSDDEHDGDGFLFEVSFRGHR